jgi:hypothetical protein
MPFREHVEQFAGKTVVDWDPEVGIENPDTTIYRLSLSYDEWRDTSWTDSFAVFLDDSAASASTGLVVGAWNFEEENEAERIVEAIVAAREKLPRLSALFFGDITSEENEISWIQQTDVSPLLEAYPALEHFRVRGGNRLRCGMMRHERLQSLIIETGGLGRNIVQDIWRSDLPALEHLELWLGDENYGATTTVDYFAPLFAGQLFPGLRYLGLRDSEMANEIAAALARSPLLERIRVLDLSLGLLDDTGAGALLACPATRKLEKLDIHHHNCSDEMIAQLEALDIEVDISELQEADVDDDGQEWRYVAVSE